MSALSRPAVSRRQVLAGSAAAAASLALAGCGGSGGSGDSDSNDLSGNRKDAMDSYAVGDQFKAANPVSFSALILSNPGYPYDKDWLFWSALKKRTNVSFEPTVVPLSDYNQKESILINGGDAPMLLPKTYHPAEEQFVAGGAILPVSDYTDLMPNFTDKVKKWKMDPDLGQLRQDDGKFYLLPGMHEAVWVDYTLAARMDVLDKLGIDTPKTWDDVHNALKEMKKSAPNSYPLEGRWKNPTGPGANCLLNLLGQAYGTAAGWGYSNSYWDRDNKTFVFTGAMDQYREMLQYLNTLINEKLLDPESFTQEQDAAVQKFATGKSFMVPTNAQTIVNDYRKGIAKIAGATVKKIPVPIGPMGAVNQGSRLENGMMISAKARDSKNFVAMMQFVDWLWYSPAGKVFAKWGIKGKTYTGSVDDGTFKLASDVDWAGLNPKGKKNLQTDFGFFNGVFAYGGSTKLLNTQFPPEELEFQKVMNKRENLPLPPPAPLSVEEREQASLWDTALTDYVNQESLKFILGKRSFGDWDKYVQELKGKNSQKYVDMINKAHQRYQEKHG